MIPIASSMQVLLRLEKETVILPFLTMTGNFRDRFLGYMGRSQPPAGHGLYLRPCGSIHTFFMRFPIDAVFLDRQERVVRVIRHVKPWRIVTGGRKAIAVIEIPSAHGNAKLLQPGMHLDIVPRNKEHPGDNSGPRDSQPQETG